MEKLIGAQKPVRRILDPDEAIAALERAVPGLVELRRKEPAVLDWHAVEKRIGTALPSDFKSLTEYYPPFELGDFLGLSGLLPGEEDDRAKAWTRELEGAGPEPRPTEPASTILLHWADSKEGDDFFWSVLGGDPDRWPVTISSHDSAWWIYEGGMVQFLAELCDGTLDPWALPRVDPELTGWGVAGGGWHMPG
ncbi:MULTISPECIES: hypothetical protein [unclassified Streptomyces]|uniref:hypothetical protein n=1 Tax=unclassified Streptomyces TaxID=2593676 RepID=UPI001F1A89CE|nr:MULTISPECIES: hypothetical protein [unclassified Streptomyces]